MSGLKNEGKQNLVNGAIATVQYSFQLLSCIQSPLLIESRLK